MYSFTLYLSSHSSLYYIEYIFPTTPLPSFSLLPFLMSPETVLLLYSCPIYIHILYIYKNREPHVRTYKSFRDCLICCTRLAPAASVFLKMTSTYVFQAERNSTMNTSHFPHSFLSCWTPGFVPCLSSVKGVTINTDVDISGVCWLEVLSENTHQWLS